MIVCKATQEHYDRLIKDGWTDKYNNIKNKNYAFEIWARDSKEIHFYPSYKNESFENDFVNNPSYDIVELIDNEWIYIQKYENVIKENIKVVWDSK